MRISIGAHGVDRYYQVRFMFDRHEFSHLAGSKSIVRVHVRGDVNTGICITPDSMGRFKLSTNGSPSFSVPATELGFVEQRLTETGINTTLSHGGRVMVSSVPEALVSPRMRVRAKMAASIVDDILGEAEVGAPAAVQPLMIRQHAGSPALPAPKEPDAIKNLVDAKDFLNLALSDFNLALAEAKKKGLPIEVVQDDSGMFSVKMTTTVML